MIFKSTHALISTLISQRIIMRLSSVCFIMALLNISLLASSQDLEVNLKQQSLETAFKQIESQTDYTFFYQADVLKGIEKREVAVKGNLKQVLTSLLKGTDLTFIIKDKVVVIRKSLEKEKDQSAEEDPVKPVKGRIIDTNQEPVIGASVYVIAKETGAISDADGYFTVDVEIGDELRVSFIGYETQNVTIETLEPFQIVLLQSIVSMDDVIILGSRATPRTQLETAVPVDVIGPQQIASSPQAELGQVLQFAAPSFHSTKQNIGHGTDHIDPVSLRGLGADQTLVLINGKRRHASSLMNVNGTVARGQVGTDLNAIPMSAVERIEVLRDGAAAQYGSDAIAGVINIILKKNINKGEIVVRSGFLAAPPEAPSFLEQFNPYSDNPDLASTRGSGGGETFQVSANYGLAIGDEGGFINMNLNYLERNPFNRMDDYTIELFSDDRRGDPIAEFAAFNQSNPAAIAAYNARWGAQFGNAIVAPLNDYTGRRVSNVGGSGTTNAGLTYNSEIPINSKSTFYSFGSFNYRLGSAVGFIRRPNQGTRQSGLWPLGFSPHLDSDIQDLSLAAGLRSEFNGWDVDLSNTYGSNSFEWTIFNTNNASQGLESGTTFDAGGLKYSQNVINLDVSRSVDVGFPLNVAFGSEFRLENFEQRAGQDESWQNYGDTTALGVLKESGSQVFPGYQRGNAINRNRFNTGVYLDLEADFTEKWLVGLAGRYEQYSDFGDNFSWKLSSRYRVTDNFTFRGAVSTGFRAPSLPQKFFSSFTLQFITLPSGEIDGVNIAHLNDDSFVTRQFGIPNLKPETSTNVSLGFTTKLSPGLSLTVDAYSIDIKDRIGITGRFQGSNDPRFDEILTNAGLTQVQFMTNAVDTETRGLDAVLNYLTTLGQADLTLTAAANFTKTEIPRDANGNPVIKTGDFLQGFSERLFNREEVSRIEVAQPQSKIILGATYSYKKWRLNLTTTRFGEVQFIHPSTNPRANAWAEGAEQTLDQTFSPKTLTDIDINFTVSEALEFSVSGSNIFNIYPDRHSHSANYGGGMFAYSRRVSQFGLAGAGFNVKALLKF